MGPGAAARPGPFAHTGGMTPSGPYDAAHGGLGVPGRRGARRQAVQAPRSRNRLRGRPPGSQGEECYEQKHRRGGPPEQRADRRPVRYDGEPEERQRFRELLEEIGTFLPGVQVLFTLFLTAPFSARRASTLFR